MGPTLSADPIHPQAGLILQKFPQYGGQVQFDPINKTVYQIITFDPPNMTEQFQFLINKRLKLKHPNLITILTIEQRYGQGDICSNQKIVAVRVQYRYVQHSLQNQIYRYCKMKRGIPQSQIIRIFSRVVECLRYLQQNGTCHGDIKPSTIFFNEQGDIRLIDSYFVHGGKTSYQLVLQNPNSLSLLSPEQLELLKLKIFDTLSDVYKNEMFSVGLSMIEATTIQPAMECYELQTLKMKDQFFIRKMGEMIQYGYSRELANLIMNCVHKKKQNRPTYDQFLSIIHSIRPARQHP